MLHADPKRSHPSFRSFSFGRRDRAAYRRWLLDTIAAQRPTTLIPCHGDILTDPQLPDRLQRLVERRF